MRSIIVAPDKDTVLAYQRTHPETKDWPYMTPRTWRTAGRGYYVDSILVIGRVELTADMFRALAPCLAATR